MLIVTMSKQTAFFTVKVRIIPNAEKSDPGCWVWRTCSLFSVIVKVLQRMNVLLNIRQCS